MPWDDRNVHLCQPQPTFSWRKGREPKTFSPKKSSKRKLLLTEEILYQLIGRLTNCLQGLYCTSQVVQDFFHQQYQSYPEKEPIHPSILPSIHPSIHPSIQEHVAVASTSLVRKRAEEVAALQQQPLVGSRWLGEKSRDEWWWLQNLQKGGLRKFRFR